MTTEHPQGDQTQTEYREIPLDDLVISDDNVRRRDIIADVGDLARSIGIHGLQQPIVVQKKGDKYEILIGQRRFLAFRELGRDKIPARIIPEELPELEAKAASFSENVHRRDLSSRDKGDVCRYLRDRLGSVKAVADYIGVSLPTVYKWLGYEAVPESIKRRVDDRKITPSQAVRLWTSLEDEGKATEIADIIGRDSPPPLVRDRILTAAEEQPKRSVTSILRRADEMQQELEITFVLPIHWSRAIDMASDKLQRDRNDIARDATIEWLEEHDFIAGP